MEGGAPHEAAAGVGAQIRDLRKARGVTLSELAEGIGRSVGYVSQVERGLSAVSIPILKAISEVLGVNISWFFQGNAVAPEVERDVVVRRDARRRLDFGGSGLTEELLSPTLGGKLELILTILAPGAETGAETTRRPGEEAGFVLSGRLDLWVGARKFRLRAGDSFAFDSAEPHRSVNPGTEETRVLWVLTPPSY